MIYVGCLVFALAVCVIVIAHAFATGYEWPG